jgi:hypothetical protein
MHSTDNLDDGYMGGGKIIKNSIKKHGKRSHEKEILELLNNRISLAEREKNIVNEELLNDPMCMNLSIGGEVCGIINEMHLKKFCKAGNKAFQEKLKNEEYRNKFIENTEECRGKGVAKCKELYESGILKMDRFKDKNHAEHSKRQIGDKNSISQKGDKNSQFGKKWIRNVETMECIKIDQSEYEKYIGLGWESGRFPNKSYCKLNESQVIEIKNMLFENIKVSEIAKSFQTSITTIRKINRGDIWTYVTLNRNK